VRSGRRSFLALVLLLSAGVLVPYALWGERFEQGLSLDGARAWIERFGAWAWAAGIALLVADVVLPIPSTIVMSALGWTYGWWLGGCVSSAGSMLAGIVAYAASRTAGRPVARWISGDEGLRDAERIFARRGGWIVAGSRWMPVLPETVACLAGLARMPWRRFLVALSCGSVPLGFAFAAIGSLGHQSPVAALALSALVPLALWSLARRLSAAPGA
jgi:uncharacterized membrane protein YdjX (TVP38/TMEM64 family)